MKELLLAKWFDWDLQTTAPPAGAMTANGAAPSSAVFGMLATAALAMFGVGESAGTFALTGTGAVSAQGAAASSSVFTVNDIGGLTARGASTSVGIFALTGTGGLSAVGSAPSAGYFDAQNGTNTGGLSAYGSSPSSGYFAITGNAAGSFSAAAASSGIFPLGGNGTLGGSGASPSTGIFPLLSGIAFTGSTPSAGVFALTGSEAVSFVGADNSAGSFDLNASPVAVTITGSGISSAYLDLQFFSSNSLFAYGASSSSSLFDLSFAIGVAPIVPVTQGGSGFVRGKKRKVVKPEDRAPDEGYAISPFATSAPVRNAATPKGSKRQKAAALADYSDHKAVLEAMLKELL